MKPKQVNSIRDTQNEREHNCKFTVYRIQGMQGNQVNFIIMQGIKMNQCAYVIYTRNDDNQVNCIIGKRNESKLS